uniref:Uncharacterized protein n=1 Tax=Anguilla anguilla TaxID=7936 RepID=A0A0E9XN08_ANGAN
MFSVELQFLSSWDSQAFWAVRYLLSFIYYLNTCWPKKCQHPAQFFSQSFTTYHLLIKRTIVSDLHRSTIPCTHQIFQGSDFHSGVGKWIIDVLPVKCFVVDFDRPHDWSHDWTG